MFRSREDLLNDLYRRQEERIAYQIAVPAIAVEASVAG